MLRRRTVPGTELCAVTHVYATSSSHWHHHCVLVDVLAVRNFAFNKYGALVASWSAGFATSFRACESAKGRALLLR